MKETIQNITNIRDGQMRRHRSALRMVGEMAGKGIAANGLLQQSLEAELMVERLDSLRGGLEMEFGAIEAKRRSNEAMYAEKIVQLHDALKAANDMLRSLHAVVERKGKETNWAGLKARLATVLQQQHDILHGRPEASTEGASRV